ncbi:hypothetical protein CA14_011686 [Aspergillus flavus]|uniref:Glutathione S-transferase n=1 Tax=Aspergillus flavus TaxID=5059 RepID=A0AB74CID0_ASPFL|nr:hypothetical protein CA14_011686 [Aspergillus flavus]
MKQRVRMAPGDKVEDSDDPTLADAAAYHMLIHVFSPVPVPKSPPDQHSSFSPPDVLRLPAGKPRSIAAYLAPPAPPLPPLKIALHDLFLLPPYHMDGGGALTWPESVRGA